MGQLNRDSAARAEGAQRTLMPNSSAARSGTFEQLPSEQRRRAGRLPGAAAARPAVGADDEHSITDHARVGSVMDRSRCLASRAAADAQAQTRGSRRPTTREFNLRAYAELLRSDLRAQKVAIITEVMQFTEAEDAAFWPVYREYEAELAKINDDRMALITEYAASYDALTDATADRLAKRALDLEARRQALTAELLRTLQAVLPAKTAARFLQVEHQILLLLDLQIAASLPIAPR